MLPPDCNIEQGEKTLTHAVMGFVGIKITHASGSPSGAGDNGSSGRIQFGSGGWQINGLGRGDTEVQRSVQLKKPQYNIIVFSTITKTTELKELTKIREMSSS